MKLRSAIDHWSRKSTLRPLVRMAVQRDIKRFRATQRQVCDRAGAQPMKLEELATYKTSDTLFVLGSGASINQITEEQWTKIARHNSIGFNFWPVHPFVPTYFMYELPGGAERADVMKRLFERRESAYAGVPFMMKPVWDSAVESAVGMMKALPSLCHRSVVTAKIPPIDNETEKAFRTVLGYLVASGQFQSVLDDNCLWARRGTLTEILCLAAGLKYRKIVLLGIDLGGTGCFFDEVQYEEEGVPLPTPAVPTGTVHSTVNTDLGDLTIDRVLAAMTELVLQPLGIELFTANPQSRLASWLPVHQLD